VDQVGRDLQWSWGVKETLVKKKQRAGGAYKWSKVGNQATGAWFCVGISNKKGRRGGTYCHCHGAVLPVVGVDYGWGVTYCQGCGAVYLW